MTPGPPVEGDHLDADTALEVAHGLLPLEATRRALDHARTCAECDRLLGEAAADHERFRARQARTLAVESQSTATATPPAPIAGHRRFLPGAVAMAAAAAIAIVAAAWLLGRPGPSGPDFPTLGLPDSPEIVYLRAPGEQTELPELERAIDLYEQARYDEVATQLAEPYTTTRLEALRRLYRTSALLERGRLEEARETLEPLAGAPLPDPYADWRDWARLRLSADPADAARSDSVVRVLAGRAGPLQAKARAILEPSQGATP